MSIKEDDVGKIIRVNSDFDLSGNTELSLVFTKTDGSQITKSSVDGVTAPTVDATATVDGVEQTFFANKYWEYESEAGLFTPSGDNWTVYGIYIDGTPKNLAGRSAPFTLFSR